MTEQQTHTMEQMALAVIRHDWTAARMLADMLMENSDAGQSVPVVPKGRLVRSGTADLKIVVFLKDDVTMHMMGTEERHAWDDMIREWVEDGGTSVLTLEHVERIEVYEVAKPVWPEAATHKVNPIGTVEIDKEAFLKS